MQTECGLATPSNTTAIPPSVGPNYRSTSAARWTSVPMVDILLSELNVVDTLTRDIPPVIPSSAKEVLLLAVVQVGNTSPTYSSQYIKIYTEEKSDPKYVQYEKYIYVVSFPQNALVTNSENLWFPMPTNRQVSVELLSAYSGNAGISLFAIGYR